MTHDERVKGHLEEVRSRMRGGPVIRVSLPLGIQQVLPPAPPHPHLSLSDEDLLRLYPYRG
jgi:hypothetical protein